MRLRRRRYLLAARCTRTARVALERGRTVCAARRAWYRRCSVSATRQLASTRPRETLTLTALHRSPPCRRASPLLGRTRCCAASTTWASPREVPLMRRRTAHTHRRAGGACVSTHHHPSRHLQHRRRPLPHRLCTRLTSLQVTRLDRRHRHRLRPLFRRRRHPRRHRPCCRRLCYRHHLPHRPFRHRRSRHLQDFHHRHLRPCRRWCRWLGRRRSRRRLHTT